MNALSYKCRLCSSVRDSSVGICCWRSRDAIARADGPLEADISPITVTSPSFGFHPMAPLGGKESTQRCHWGETQLQLAPEMGGFAGDGSGGSGGSDGSDGSDGGEGRVSGWRRVAAWGCGR